MNVFQVDATGKIPCTLNESSFIAHIRSRLLGEYILVGLEKCKMKVVVEGSWLIKQGRECQGVGM